MSEHPTKKIVILGCTGSIGDTAIKVIRNLGSGYRIVGLSAGRQVDKLVMLSERCKPQVVAVSDESDAVALGRRLPGVEILSGLGGLTDLARLPDVDIVLNGLVGAVGLGPTLTALELGRTVAMANKEPLVMAGGLILEAAQRNGGTILPLDSEPNAIWQCLQGEGKAVRLILTASGGAFRDWSLDEMRAVTPVQALQHPTWKMGRKITIDCATLMNKGFEAIEASWLFSVPLESVDVVIHRESVVHSMVEFVDGSILAHLGKTDMLLPIQYALTHPERAPAPMGRLDLVSLGELHFAEPDWERFPCLQLCYDVGAQAGTAPACLNAANEVAVRAFLDGHIDFLDIYRINRDTVADCQWLPASTVEEVLEADYEARRRAESLVSEAVAA